MSDGKWHSAELKWMQGELWLNTDYGYHEKTVPVDSKLVGLEVTKVSIGGLNDDEDPFIGLIGCIKDVRLGNQRHQWLRTSVEHRVGEGCSSSDSCSSRSDVCPAHGICTDTWNSHTCTCEPGKQKILVLSYQIT